MITLCFINGVTGCISSVYLTFPLTAHSSQPSLPFYLLNSKLRFAVVVPLHLHPHHCNGRTRYMLRIFTTSCANVSLKLSNE